MSKSGVIPEGFLNTLPADTAPLEVLIQASKANAS